MLSVADNITILYNITVEQYVLDGIFVCVCKRKRTKTVWEWGEALSVLREVSRATRSEMNEFQRTVGMWRGSVLFGGFCYTRGHHLVQSISLRGTVLISDQLLWQLIIITRQKSQVLDQQPYTGCSLWVQASRIWRQSFQKQRLDIQLFVAGQPFLCALAPLCGGL